MTQQNKALIVVDVQNDFLPGGALAVVGGDEIVPVVNALTAAFETVVLTADWHPAGHVSFASSHAGSAPFDVIAIEGTGSQVLWPDHCVAGTEGADFAPGLETTHAAVIVRKGMHENCDSYSGFMEADRKTKTGLAGWLAERGIREVWVCGLATDFCVSWTALDAAAAGFTVHVVEEASRAIDADGSLAKARAAWAEAGVDTVTVADTLKALGR